MRKGKLRAVTTPMLLLGLGLGLALSVAFAFTFVGLIGEALLLLSVCGLVVQVCRHRRRDQTKA